MPALLGSCAENPSGPPTGDGVVVSLVVLAALVGAAAGVGLVLRRQWRGMARQPSLPALRLAAVCHLVQAVAVLVPWCLIVGFAVWGAAGGPVDRDAEVTLVLLLWLTVLLALVSLVGAAFFVVVALGLLAGQRWAVLTSCVSSVVVVIGGVMALVDAGDLEIIAGGVFAIATGLAALGLVLSARSSDGAGVLSR